MPNLQNVDSPLTLVAFGRAGTSLLHDVFNRHPQFEAAGETTELIFGTHLAAELAHDLVRWQPGAGGGALPKSERCAAAVRGAMVAMLPSDRPRWMQKPTGLPVLRPYPPGGYDPSCPAEFPCEWYWRVLAESFPRGRFFTVLREPCDVVLSAHQFWGWTQAQVWAMLADHARLLCCPESRVEYAVEYDRLVRGPEREVRALFERFDVPWRPEVLAALDVTHVPAAGRERLTRGATSRRDQWPQLDPSAVPHGALRAIHGVWSSYGCEFVLPPHFADYAPIADALPYAKARGEAPASSDGGSSSGGSSAVPANEASAGTLPDAARFTPRAAPASAAAG